MSVITPPATVAAIIPTNGRTSVVAAVRSVLDQSQQPDDVVVITAEPNEARVRELLANYLDRVRIETTDQESPTGGFLRYLGTQSTQCDWYAFLDDDDEWFDTKLELQLHYARTKGLDVASSALLFRGPDADGDKTIPALPYREGEAVADYLFAGRSARVDRPLLHTSTLVVSKDAIDTVNWDPALAVHQDWDLVLRLDAAGFRIGQSGEALTYVATGSSGSMSATNKWLASYTWWLRSRDLMSRKASSDFLYSQVLRYALRERSRTGLKRVLKSARHEARPSMSAVVIAVTGLVPRGLFEKAMLRDAGATGADAPVVATKPS